jgi:hypothetical protein
MTARGHGDYDSGMRLSLSPHPDTPSAAIQALEVEVGRLDPDALSLTYRLRGDIARVRLASPAAPARTDALWRTTCFEAFLKPEGGEGYLELNFAPSSQWAAYVFTGYREGMAPLDVPAPSIVLTADADVLELVVTVRGLPPGPCRLALSAVIEEAGGAKSYWALAHRAERADFHADVGFAALLS